MRFRHQLDRALRHGRQEPARTGAGPVNHERNPDPPETLDHFRLFAVVKTWMDEDVIEATVRNALVQGVEAVYLVDNGSSDATVRCAEAAGAKALEVHESDIFDGRLIQALMNAVVARQSLESGAEHAWWLYLDSDEFPEGPDGMTLREYLATLDRRFRMVGARYVNHLPHAKPEYLAGYHPIDFQPLCYEFAPARWPPCELGHWKHPLQRFDRDGHFILANDGAHSAFCHGRLTEPIGGIVTHHFQFRDEERTRSKIDLSSGPGSTRTDLHESMGFDGFMRRRRSIDAVYSGRWADVETLPNADPTAVMHLEPWADLATLRRWYQIDELEAARKQWAASRIGAEC